MTNYFTFNGQDFDDYFVRQTVFTGYEINSLWSMGYNGFGVLGDNTLIHRSSPVQTVAGGTNWKQVSAGGNFGNGACSAFGIKTDNSLWGWGDNSYGQLGTNDGSSRTSPIQTISAGNNWKQVSVGGFHTAAIKTDGTLWTWGYNIYGQLADNTQTSRSSPIQTVSAGTNWKQVSCGRTHTAAIKTDGTLWLWGYNWRGELGDNTIIHRSSPVQTVSGGTNWKQVSTGNSITAAIKNDGTLWTWGNNQNSGALGDNTEIDKSSPIQTIAAGTNWSQVSAGDGFMGAVKTDGTLWLWGVQNPNVAQGNLGDNTQTNKSSPVQTVSAGTNWKQVSCGLYNTSAIKTDGTLWVWGNNAYGQLGDNTRTHRSSPVQTVSGGTNWKQAVSAIYFTGAIKDQSNDF